MFRKKCYAHRSEKKCCSFHICILTFQCLYAFTLSLVIEGEYASFFFFVQTGLEKEYAFLRTSDSNGKCWDTCVSDLSAIV